MCFSYSVNLNAQTLQSKLNLGEVVVPNPGYFFSGFTHPFLPVIVSDVSMNKGRNATGVFQTEETFTGKNGLEKQEVERGNLVCRGMRWGLVPSWVKEVSKADELSVFGLNARCETLMEKPMFRDAWKNKPCLVPASGFFEWKTVGKKKVPYYIYPAEDDLFLFAGLFSEWVNPETGEEVATYGIITTEANGMMSDIHNTKQRMPAIVPLELAKNFLMGDAAERSKCLGPYPDAAMKAHAVSPLASNARANRNVVSVLQPFSEDYSQTLF